MIRTEIKPTEVFDAEGLREALGLNANTLAREVRKQRLRVCKKAKRHFFIGQDVLAWLRAGEVIRERESVAVGGNGVHG
jgi:hypothetical protein